MRGYLGSLAVVSALLLIGCSKGPAGKEDAPPDTTLTVEAASVEQKTLHETAILDGNYAFAPGDYARLAPASPGRLAKVLVREGDHVEKGQLLAQIDLSVLDAQKQSAGLAASAAAAQSRQANASLQAAQRDLKSQIRAAELGLDAAVLERNSNVEAAQTDLDKLVAGARPQEVAQAEQALRQARVNRDHAKSDSDRDQMLLKEGYVSGQQAESSKAAFEVADSGYKQAEQQLQLVKIGARQEDLKAARIRLDAARRLGDKKIEAARTAVEQARQGSLSVSAKAAEAAAGQLTATQKIQDASAATGQAGFGEIRAPFDGIVGRRTLNPGDSADPTTPVIELVRKGSNVEFSGAASSSIATKFATSMAVCELDSADPIGSVRSIGIADAQTGLVPVKVSLSHTPEGASPGQFGRLRVVLKSLKNALAVPAACIVTRDDKEYVYLVSNGKAVLKEVTVGPTESNLTAILKGIEKGQQVVVLGQHELSDGAKIEIAKPDADAPKGDSPKAEAGKPEADK